MSAGWTAFLNILVIALEQLMVYMLSEGMFRRRFSAPLTLCLFIVSAPPIWFVYSLLAEHMYLRVVLGCALMSAMVLLGFRTNAVKAVFTGAFIGAFLQLADTALVSVVCEWLGISVQHFLFGPFEYYALCFFIKTVELFFIIALQFVLRHRFPGRAASASDWIRALAFPASSFVISTLLLRSVIAAPEATKELLVCVIIVLLTDVMSFFVLNYMERQSEAVRDNAILRHNIKLELDNITAWREAYSGQRKLTHDYQNQLLVIRGMVEQDAAKSDLLTYLDGLQAQLTPAATLVNTHRPAADIIINQKLSIAKSKDISFRYQLDDLSTVSLPDDELVTVLANLIDNAIEACEEISEPEKRHILLKFKVKDEAAFLYIENSTAKPVRVRNNVVQYALKTGLINFNPADRVERPKKNDYTADIYDRYELAKLFEAAKGTKLELAVILGAFYGLRRSEIVGLRWDAIDFERNLLTIKYTVTEAVVDGKYEVVEKARTKTKSSRRTLPLVLPFASLLQEMRKEQEKNRGACGKAYCTKYLDFVYVNELGERIKPGYISSRFPVLLEENGLRRIRFHDLRHSCASLLYANGVSLKDIQEWLGHSNISTTANIYTHLDFNSKLASAQAIIDVFPK